MRRWPFLGLGIAIAVAVPGSLSDYYRGLAADAAVDGILVLSLVLLAGYVGQISFCQYSFAALGALTVGALADGQGWSVWAALPLGILFAALAGVLVGIPALRLSGLYLAILTIAVALLFDRFVLAPGTWDAFTGGITGWRPPRPSILGASLAGEYAYYLFVLGVLLLLTLLLWNVSRGKSGRVFRAVRDAEVAAATLGYNLTSWKLLAFALSAGLAGLAGGLGAIRIGSVSASSYGFQQSLQLVAVATVMGLSSITSAPIGGAVLAFGVVLLDKTPLSTQAFPLVVGAALVAQLVLAPEGVVTKTQADLRRVFSRRATPVAGIGGVS